MSDDSAEIAAPHYRAFISYSHADGRFAGWLHRKLEGARLPDKKRLSPIFFDRAELAAGPDLSAQVREALAQSAALVVIASPAARVSRWVGQEIALFRALHPDRPILAALIEGEPADAFPDALLSHDGAAIEPLAADFRKGKDGKRLGLLKIVAGLTAQPLDRLVQRDAQARQRRVMAVTAGAVLLSLVLAAALVLAIRARAEAERQRADAEGLVEFMLTDLRDKLKGVGRLDVMDAVNQRVLQRYAAERNLTALPDDVLLRRAQLLRAMAEDDLATSNKRDEAKAKFTEAWRVTGALLKRYPTDPKRLFDHAQSEYWMGYVGYLDRGNNPATALAVTERHWQAYLTLAERLVAQDPGSRTWRRELAYAEGNICTLLLEIPARAASALKNCSAARQEIQKIADQSPTDLELQLDLANRLAWEADSLTARGQHKDAVGVRQRQLAIVKALGQRFPRDARVAEANLLANYGLAKSLKADRQPALAQSVAANARAAAQRLRELDPANRSWQEWQSKLDRDFPRQ